MGILCTGSIMLILLFFSSSAMDAALNAASVFVHGVMPALFPMMIISQLMRPMDVSKRPNGANLRLLGGNVLFAFAAGSPASTQRTMKMHSDGLLPKPYLLPMLAAGGVMSPMFFLGTLAGWTGLTHAALIILLIHWLSALITSAVVSSIKRSRGSDASSRPAFPSSTQGKPPTPPRSILAALPSAIASSAQSLLCVCGSMMLFSIIAALIGALLSTAFPLWTASHPKLLAIMWAALEIGGGASALITAYPAPPLTLLCALCSFGGLSIWMQNLLFIGNSIRPAKLLLIRMLHGAISYGLCHLLFSIFPLLTETFSQPQAIPAPAQFSAVIPILLIGIAAYPLMRRRFSAS
ncbi:MAG: hypothetical protein GX096_02150 [Clostridiales bacterium]|nr:hypothetical protein [Clostridiales bacterium]